MTVAIMNNKLCNENPKLYGLMMSHNIYMKLILYE